ncbi:MAG: metal-dependent hydrolase [Candidatus Pacearchaeota archaeon]
MLFKTHLVFGILVFFILNLTFEIPNKIIFLVFVILGALIVDIDIKNSKVGRHWFLRPFQFFTKHRGMVHSLVFGILISLFIAWIGQWAGFGFFAGYFSHLFLDSLTRSGVALFWPLSSKRFGFGIKSGGILEEIVFVLILLADFWFSLNFFGIT